VSSAVIYYIRVILGLSVAYSISALKRQYVNLEPWLERIFIIDDMIEIIIF
jgi:hypothetical protein